MMCGTIIGESRKPVINPFSGKFARVNPSAARVPSEVASTTTAPAIVNVFWIESRQAGDEKNSWYHCSEKPGIGYVNIRSELKDRGIMVMIGATKKNKIEPHII
jgi:hypothetical protein